MDEEILSSCIQESEKGVYLDITVSPDSPASQIKGVNRWRNNVELGVKERAEGGKANHSIIALLADGLSVSEKNMKIVQGKRSKQKRVFIFGVGKGEIVSHLSKKIGEK